MQDTRSKMEAKQSGQDVRSSPRLACLRRVEAVGIVQDASKSITIVKAKLPGIGKAFI